MPLSLAVGSRGIDWGVRWFAMVLARMIAMRGMRVMPRAFVLAMVLAFGAAAPVASAEPPTTHEILTEKPSGFWTSNRPAVGGAYRWRLLGLGVVIAAVTGYGMLRLIRRANAEREGRGTTTQGNDARDR